MISINLIELEVLQKSASGQSLDSIAEELDLPKEVIVGYRYDILQKTNAIDAMHALMAIAKSGFVLTEEKIMAGIA